MIDAHGVTFRYEAHAPTITFPDIRLSQGEHCLMLGNSGSGKTTFLHILAGIRRPATGRVIVGNQELSGLGGAALDRYRGQSVGLVFQQPHLLGSLSVTQNLQLAQYLARLPQQTDAIDELLVRLQLTHRRDALPHTLSQGEAQRVTIARALLNRPRVLMADEPTSSLDDENCYQVLRLLRRQAEHYQATLIVATHDQRIKQEVPQHIMLSS